MNLLKLGLEDMSMLVRLEGKEASVKEEEDQEEKLFEGA